VAVVPLTAAATILLQAEGCVVVDSLAVDSTAAAVAASMVAEADTAKVRR
jgi:hypothetical protein